MFKKLLLVTLSAFTFVGLTGCGSAKKLTAEEAKTEIKAAKDNTLTALQNSKALTFKQDADFSASVTAKNIGMAGTAQPLVKSAKISASASDNFSATVDTEKLDFKATADAKAKLGYNITMGDKTQKKDFNFSGNGEAYLINGKNKSNLYAKGSASLPKKEDLAELISLASFLSPEIADFFEDFDDLDIKEKLEGKINIGIDKVDDKYDPEEMIEELDFDTLIKDWSIFSKKGSTLIADCSNLNAFNFDFDEDMEAQLEALGLKLNISKFEIGLTNDNAISSFDFKLALKGDIDLAKAAKAAEEASPMLGSLTGTINVNVEFGLGFDVTYSTSAASITAPKELTDLEEVSIDDLFPAGKEAAAIKKAEEIFSVGKMIIIEDTATEDIEFVTKVGDTYSVTVKALVDNHEIDSNPFTFDSTDEAGGGVIMYNAATNEWSFTMTGTIDGYEIFYYDGEFDAYQAEN